MSDRHTAGGPLAALGALVGGVFAFAVGVAAYTARQLNEPVRRDLPLHFTFTPWEMQSVHEPVQFVSDDGVTLRGWWLPAPESRRVIVCCTGHRGAKHDLLGIAAALCRSGNNVLLFDFRGCGESDVVPLSLAFHELRDARAAVRFARDRVPGARVGILGYSMGGAVAIMLAAEDPTIDAVVADSPFATIRDTVAHAYRSKHVPAQPLLALASLYNRLRYGYSFDDVRPVDVIDRISPRPLLLIHGAEDTIIPVEQAHRLAGAAGPRTDLWVVQGSQHVGAYFDDRFTYTERVCSFFAHGLSDVTDAHTA